MTSSPYTMSACARSRVCSPSPASRVTTLSTAIVGLGVNVDWAKGDYPDELAESMWSLSEASGRRRIDRDALLAAWLERLGPLYEDLQAGHFDSLRWADAQITTGSSVEVDTGSGSVRGTAVGIDRESGSLLVRTGPGQPWARSPLAMWCAAPWTTQPPRCNG